MFKLSLKKVSYHFESVLLFLQFLSQFGASISQLVEGHCTLMQGTADALVVRRLLVLELLAIVLKLS